MAKYGDPYAKIYCVYLVDDYTKYFHNAKNVEIIIKDIDYFNAKQELNRLNRINNTNCYKVAHTVEVQPFDCGWEFYKYKPTESEE